MKQRMRNGKFNAIWIPIVSVFAIASIALNVVEANFGGAIDTQLGRGKRHVKTPEGVEDWDTDYYQKKYKSEDEAKTAAQEKMYETVAEGMTLLKNDGVLPLAKQSTVTPFGRGYVHPDYNSMSEGGSVKYTPEGHGVSPKQALEKNFTIISSAADLQPKDIGEKTSYGKVFKDENGNFTGAEILHDYTGYPDAPKASEGTRPHNINTFDFPSQLLELKKDVYSKIKDEDLTRMKTSTGLVFITRSGSEGDDKKMDGYTDGTPHYLALSQNEKDMIKYAKEKCQKVVLIVNSSNPVELMPVMQGELEVNAIVWAGHPGDVGFNALSDILCGKVNPSGRTVDSFATDFLKTPSFKNFGDFHYNNVKYKDVGRPYVEYQDGMYLGYRYYETAFDLKATGFKYGTLDENGKCLDKGEVAYPFGYGLSYSKFDWDVQTLKEIGEKFEIDVKVTNKSDLPGKDVVQLYLDAPYTDFDKENKIEKPTASLLAFGKTKLLNKGESDVVKLNFNKDDLTSYCYTIENPDQSKGCYILDQGEYKFSVRRNSHDEVGFKTWSNNKLVKYDNSNPREYEKQMQCALDDDGNMLPYPEKDPTGKFIAATNLFPYMSEYMQENSKLLTRTDWDNTKPFGTKETSKAILDKFKNMLGIENSFDYKTDKELGNVEGSYIYKKDAPTQKADNGLTALDMRGKDYYDPDWELLLDQLDFDKDKADIRYNLVATNYHTNPISSIGLPASEHCEGANGVRLGNGVLAEEDKKTSSWPMAPMIASTYNVKLIEEVGEALSQEALQTGKSGRYAPAFDLHRSPFNGRCMEYYSEDCLLSGKVAAAMVTGTSKGGMFDYIKHFGLNDQETNRAEYLCTWADEQTIREVYNRPFEICIREARKTIKYTADDKGTVKTKVMRGVSALMMAQNCFGPRIAWTNYDLVTKLVRNEWNFNGIINTDMFSGSPQFVELGIRAGVDSWLVYQDTINMQDLDSPTMRNAIRDRVHNFAYTIVNSNTLNNCPPGTIITYSMAPWRGAVLAITIVTFTAAGLLIAIAILRYIDSRKHPENYKPKKVKEKKADAE